MLLPAEIIAGTTIFGLLPLSEVLFVAPGMTDVLLHVGNGMNILERSAIA